LIKRNRSEKKSANNRAYSDLLKGIDKETVDSFTPKQLNAIKRAIHKREWRTHRVDFRPTIAFPFIPWSFYMVFLFDVNRRDLLPSERFMACFMFLFLILIIGVTAFGFILLILYLVKSALGIDIFPNDSVGIWDEFKRLFKD